MLSQSKRGRKSEYTSEQILRSLIVMFVEQDSLRQVVIRIENSEFLRMQLSQLEHTKPRLSELLDSGRLSGFMTSS